MVTCCAYQIWERTIVDKATLQLGFTHVVVGEHHRDGHACRTLALRLCSKFLAQVARDAAGNRRRQQRIAQISTVQQE